MYEIGEYIVHPGQGVCLVEDVVDNPSATYQLLPVGQRHPMRISFPVASESRLRPVLSHEEAEDIIAQYPTMQVDEFTNKSNALEEEHFRDEIRLGSCRDSVRVVKTFRTRIAEVKARNKKPPVAYERILKQASERSLSELAVALDLTPDDVRVLFEDVPDENEIRQN
jgi:CarD family transcriptional regulator